MREIAINFVISVSPFSGMDLPNIRYIIHYGMPCSIDDYIQETGRAGRDGALAHAILLQHKDANRGSSISEDCKAYSKTATCLRQELLRHFNTSPTIQAGFLCCINCTQSYSCCSCGNLSACDHRNSCCYCVKWCFSLPYPETFMPCVTISTTTTDSSTSDSSSDEQ